MEDELEESGVSMGDLWRAAKKRLWIILLAALAFASVAVLAFVIYINPHASDYTIEFLLTYPGSQSLKYPDGTRFYYRDIISKDSLSAVRDSEARFADIDVFAMIQSDDVRIERKNDIAEEKSEENEGVYVLSVKQFYFHNQGDASAFLRGLAQLPVDEVKERSKMLDFSLDKNVFDGVTFEDKLSLLMEQKAEILARYDAWITEYSGDYIVEGKSLKNYRTEASVVIGDVLFQELTKELEDYGYVSRDLLYVKVAELREEKEINEKKINEIKAMLESVRPSVATIDSSNYEDGLAEVLAKLIEKNVEIDRQIAALTFENVISFEERIGEEYENMQSIARTISNIATALYEQESRVDFKTTNAVSEGSISTVLVGIGVFVLAALIAGAIVCAVELPKMRAKDAKKALAAQGAEDETCANGGAAESSEEAEKKSAETDSRKALEEGKSQEE